MAWTEPQLVQLDSGFITAIDIACDDLIESSDYLKWVMKNKKRRLESFDDHKEFFAALVDELDAAINLFESIRPPTEKYDRKSRVYHGKTV